MTRILILLFHIDLYNKWGFGVLGFWGFGAIKNNNFTTINFNLSDLRACTNY